MARLSLMPPDGDDGLLGDAWSLKVKRAGYTVELYLQGSERVNLKDFKNPMTANIHNPHRFHLPEEPGVYFLRVGTKAKIGCSMKLAARAKSISDSQAPGKRPVIMGYISVPTQDRKDLYALERSLHWRFKRDRVAGEWYWWTEEMERFIQRHPQGVMNRCAIMTNVTWR